MARKLYRRGADLVAVRHIRLSASEALEAGQPVPQGMREFQRRSLWRRRLVAHVDCPWGAAQIRRRVTDKVKDRSTSDAQKAALLSLFESQSRAAPPAAAEVLPSTMSLRPPEQVVPPIGDVSSPDSEVTSNPTESAPTVTDA